MASRSPLVLLPGRSDSPVVVSDELAARLARATVEGRPARARRACLATARVGRDRSRVFFSERRQAGHLYVSRVARADVGRRPVSASAIAQPPHAGLACGSYLSRRSLVLCHNASNRRG